ncbi:ROK family protein [Ideonella sp. A 288]|uniref:ROK family protein n=1 Tax=Ideonella sp. A 288 TaxID=1962181 RepID=UPI000B4B844F|nr:ROK family protein [Ideonella sp. A 288]
MSTDHPTTPSAAIGIDLGGTKIEAVVLDPAGQVAWGRRIASPSQRYDTLVEAIAGLAEAALASPVGAGATIGLGTPGSLTPEGLVKNANTTCLNGRPLQRDLSARLGRPVRVANDANCLALSEATDGAGAGAGVVFAAILGTGTGAGIAVDGRVLTGPNGLAGEWGHNPLPWRQPDDPWPACYCGQSGCIEALVSGPALARDHAQRTGASLTAEAVAQAARQGDAACTETLARWHHRLARALAQVINTLDPDVIVLGGGLSRIDSVYREVPALWDRWVFSGGLKDPVRTPLRPARHGDASGVRGAAWLWKGTFPR